MVSRPIKVTPKWHPDQLSRFARLTNLTNRHTDIHNNNICRAQSEIYFKRYQSTCFSLRVKMKGTVFIQRHLYYASSQSAQMWIMQFYLQITPFLPVLCKRSPDGVTANWGSRYPFAAYYSFIDPKGMKGWVGLVSWPIADGLPT